MGPAGTGPAAGGEQMEWHGGGRGGRKLGAAGAAEPAARALHPAGRKMEALGGYSRVRLSVAPGPPGGCLAPSVQQGRADPAPQLSPPAVAPLSSVQRVPGAQPGPRQGTCCWPQWAQLCPQHPWEHRGHLGAKCASPGCIPAGVTATPVCCRPRAHPGAPLPGADTGDRGRMLPVPQRREGRVSAMEDFEIKQILVRTRRAETCEGRQTSALDSESHELPAGPQCQGPLLGHSRVLGPSGCTSGAFGAVGSRGWLKEVGDGETEAELRHWGRCVPRAIGRHLCPSRHVARCITEHPPTRLQPPQAEAAPAPLGKRGHSTEELIGGFRCPVGHGRAGPR